MCYRKSWAQNQFHPNLIKMDCRLTGNEIGSRGHFLVSDWITWSYTWLGATIEIKFFYQSGIAILSIDSRNPHVEVFSLRKSYKDCLLCLTFIGCGLPWKYLFSIHLPFCTLIGRIWPFHQLCWNLLGNSLDAHPSLQGMMRWYAMHDAICQICVLLIKVEKSIMLNLCSFA